MYILVELASFGSLLEYLRAAENSDNLYQNLENVQITLTSRLLVEFAYDIACGMEFLASNKVFTNN